MKLLRAFFVVNLAIFLCPVCAQEKVVRELEFLRIQFEAKVETGVEEPFQKGIAELNTQYGRALDEARGEAQKLGKLDEAVTIKSEQLRVTSGQPLPLVDEPDISEYLKRQRQTYRKSLSLLANRRDSALSVFQKAYTKELNELIISLTKQGRLEDAMAARERLKALSLSTPDATASGISHSASGVVVPIEKLTADQAEIVKGLRIGKIELPDRRGLTYFGLHTTIDNRSQQGLIEKRISVDVRVLCVDGDGKANVVTYTDDIDIPQKGRQLVTYGGGVELKSIKLRNNNDEIPKNAHVAFKIDGSIFHEDFLTNRGDEKWWLRDDLIKK
jgi:hypothetical protein